MDSRDHHYFNQVPEEDEVRRAVVIDVPDYHAGYLVREMALHQPSIIEPIVIGRDHSARDLGNGVIGAYVSRAPSITVVDEGHHMKQSLSSQMDTLALTAVAQALATPPWLQMGGGGRRQQSSEPCGTAGAKARRKTSKAKKKAAQKIRRKKK